MEERRGIAERLRKVHQRRFGGGDERERVLVHQKAPRFVALERELVAMVGEFLEFVEANDREEAARFQRADRVLKLDQRWRVAEELPSAQLLEDSIEQTRERVALRVLQFDVHKAIRRGICR